MTRNFPKNIRPLKTILFIIALLWMVFFISWAIPIITQFGIKPRTLEGIVGIFVAPLLHGNIAHLSTNSLALFVLGLIFISVEKARAAYIIIPIYLLSGLGSWIIGRAGAIHIGASGIIYGLFGYLISIGIFRKNAKLILLSLALLAVYGSMLWGVLPLIDNPLVSWEGHLSGLLSGIITARAEANLTT